MHFVCLHLCCLLMSCCCTVCFFTFSVFFSEACFSPLQGPISKTPCCNSAKLWQRTVLPSSQILAKLTRCRLREMGFLLKRASIRAVYHLIEMIHPVVTYQWSNMLPMIILLMALQYLLQCWMVNLYLQRKCSSLHSGLVISWNGYFYCKLLKKTIKIHSLFFFWLSQSMNLSFYPFFISTYNRRKINPDRVRDFMETFFPKVYFSQGSLVCACFFSIVNRLQKAF